MLTGLIWNGRGIGDKNKRDFINENLNSKSVDFLGIQETMRHDFPQTVLETISGNLDFSWCWIPAKGRSGGILAGANKNTTDVLERETGDYFVRLLLCNKSDGFTWNLVVVYGDAQQAGKAPFLVELVHIIHKTKFPLMITGDFNMTRRSSDKNKPGGFNKWSVLFNSVIAQGNLWKSH
jgi:exonuclease III